VAQLRGLPALPRLPRCPAARPGAPDRHAPRLSPGATAAQSAVADRPGVVWS
jgi:hypothetical protein